MALKTSSALREAAQLESTSAPETIVRNVLEETLGSGSLIVTGDAVSAKYVGQVAGMSDLYLGPTGFKQFVSRIRGALYDLDVTIDGIVARDVDVVVRWTANGRLERPFLGVEPPCVVGDAGQEPGGRTMTVAAVTIARIGASKIQESRTEWTTVAVE